MNRTDLDNRPQPFDLANTPLAKTNLIEAGAGTGKTYAIAGLYVRLLIESALPVKEILVVTYTVAATDELKDRIRRRVRDAQGAFQSGQGTDDFISALLAKYPQPEQRAQAAERLTRAMRDFDEAAIYTIHGFCQRVLRENAFESGELFDTELITDDQQIRLEIVEDFWRSHFYETAPEVAAYALEQKQSPESLLRFLGNRAFLPEWRIVPEIEPPDNGERERLVDALRRELSTLQAGWPTFRNEVSTRLTDSALKANIYGSRVPGLIAEMDLYLAGEKPSLFPFAGLEKFTASKIAASIRKGTTSPEHPVFELCRTIWELSTQLKAFLDRHLLFLKRELIRVMMEELPRKKQERNVQYFDDLLLRLRRALLKPGGEGLTEAIRRRYRAALIDEFQDTDPVQYAIFSTIFRTEGNILFLIGDPKQAIYSFRGADIFAYLTAASQADAIHTLDANWRSDPDLIRAVNALFSHRENPFVFPEIAFRPARAGNETFDKKLTIDGSSDHPLKCWFIDTDGGDEAQKPLAKGIAQPRVARSVAVEIARLLHLGKEGRALIGGRPLREGDIAILVRTNREARLCREQLADLRIPVVLHSTGDLFASPEAMEIERLLMALLSPDREDLLLAALATDMIGYNLQMLDALREDEPAWENRRDRFRSYHRIWEKGGFLKMFRSFLHLEKVRCRLLAFADGERRLTNCIHLSEVLHREAGERNLGMAALVKWLTEKRETRTASAEQHQLRLESDAEAIRIVTIHKSKGLQYPVVFCPFPWGVAPEQEGMLCFHDPVDHGQVCDLGSEDYADHQQWARREALAEDVRLFYVALTRAQNRCTFVWGRINGVGRSAPAYLLHGGGDAEDPVSETEKRYKELSGRQIYDDLQKIAEKANGAMELLEMPSNSDVQMGGKRGDTSPFFAAENREVSPLFPVPQCREFSGAIDLSWRVSSFSHLTYGSGWNSELPDRDSDKEIRRHVAESLSPISHTSAVISDEIDPVFTFPKGSRSGTLLHEILEKVDFTKTEESRPAELIAAKLRENGFDPQWQGAVEEMVRRVVCHPLVSDSVFQNRKYPADDHEGATSLISGEKETIFLSRIGMDQRLNEIEFYFPLKRLTREGLSRLFRKTGISERSASASFAESLDRLQFDPVRGFMKGFIDMIFRFGGRYYLVDWKSNFLGSNREDYHRKRLAAVMTEHHYLLQYHLYLMALHRYLLRRLPGYDYRSHFGGVFYLFLRGMNPAWGADYGVYYDRPDPERVRFLCGEMIETGDTA
ncbi:MAG: exodeoxyribonuclease V subunit beta [Syntrophales bacterium]